MSAPTVDGQSMRPAAEVKLSEQVRVAVIFAGQQTDVTVPANSPVAAVVEALIPLLASQRENIGGEAAVTAGRVSFTRINGEVLDRAQTLAQQQVLDGELLVLEVNDAEVGFTPIIENASSAVAMLNFQRFSAVTAATAVVFSAVAVAVATVVVTVLLGNVWRLQRAGGHDPAIVAAVIEAGLAVVLLAAGTLIWWRRRQPVVPVALWCSALLAAPAAAVMATPGPVGAAQVAWAAVTAAGLAVVLWQLTPVPRGVMAFVALVGGAAAILAFLRLLAHIEMTYLWVGTLAVAVFVLTNAQSIAGRMAGIPLPPFPTVTGKLLFDDAEEIAAEALTAAEHEGTPSMTQLVAGAAAANTYLSALVASCSVFFLLAAVELVRPHQGRWWLATVYVGILAIILVLRGRALTDRAQAIVIVATGLAMATGVAVKYALLSTQPWVSLAAAAVVALLGVSGLVVAAAVPPRVFSPTFRKVVEFIEYPLVVAVLPLALWLCNIYHLARNH
jgi:type VII secretion integral membrane protein EccD